MNTGEFAYSILQSVRTRDDAYAALCSTVILFACNDYRKARLRGDRYGMYKIERFFKSWAFDVYSRGRVSGEYILRKLNEETIEELKERYRLTEGAEGE